MGLSWQQGLDITSVLCVFCGTYLITKVSFVDAIKKKFQKIVTFHALDEPLFRFACKVYFINEENWKDHMSGKKEAATAYEPFAGFVWICAASIIQILRIIFLK